MLEIIFALLFAVSTLATFAALAVVMPFPSHEEQEEAGINLHGQGR